MAAIVNLAAHNWRSGGRGRCLSAARLCCAIAAAISCGACHRSHTAGSAPPDAAPAWRPPAVEYSLPSLRAVQQRVLRQPGSPGAQFVLGLEWYARADYASACTALRRSVSLGGRHAEVFRYLAWSLRAQGQIRAARKAMRLALHLARSQTDRLNALMFIGNSYLDQNDLHGARSAFSAAKKSAPGYGVPDFGLATVAGMAGDNRLAQKYLRAASRLHLAADDNAKVQFALGQIAQQQGDRTQAALSYRAALRSEPDFPDAGSALRSLR